MREPLLRELCFWPPPSDAPRDSPGPEEARFEEAQKGEARVGEARNGGDAIVARDGGIDLFLLFQQDASFPQLLRDDERWDSAVVA